MNKLIEKILNEDIHLTSNIATIIGITDENNFDLILEIENQLDTKIKVHTTRHTASNLLELKYILSSLNKEIRKINASCFFFDNKTIKSF